MENFLTDPELINDVELQEIQNLKKRHIKFTYIEKQNKDLQRRITDLETSLGINKQIIGALIDATQNQDNQSTFQIFQKEIAVVYQQLQDYYLERDGSAASHLINEQIKEELSQRESHTQKVLEATI